MMLYHLFAELCEQDHKFSRTWLHLFIRLHKRFFNNMAKGYLTRKGLSLDNWLDSVQEGRKGDVLTLLGLCMLIEKHALVHLKNGKIWTSLRDSQHSHNEALARSDIHLIYVGRGNFAKMSCRKVPLHIAENTTTSQSLVVRTILPFTPHEDKALNDIIKAGLGMAISREKPPSTLLVGASPTMAPASTSTVPIAAACKIIEKTSIPPRNDPETSDKPDTKPIAIEITTSSSRSTETVPLTGTAGNVTQPELNKSLNYARLILYPVNVKPGERVIVDQNLLDSFPSNKYGDVVQQGSRLMSKVRRPSPNTDMESDGNSSDATIPYV